MNIKYVIFDKTIPIVFSEFQTHDEVARAMGRTPTSAGFAQIVDNKFECWGESVSLDLKSGGAADSKILNIVFELLGS